MPAPDKPIVVRGCIGCHKILSIERFHKDSRRSDGRKTRCIQCRREERSRFRAAHLEEVQKAIREYKTKNAEHIFHYYQEYKKRNSARTMENNRKSRVKNRKRWRAYEVLSQAIKMGRVQRPAVCSDCGGEGRIHGHHVDYSKPLDVEWLCQVCHMQRHGKQSYCPHLLMTIEPKARKRAQDE